MGGLEMKVLLVSTSDLNGGAARAAYRLHKSLLNQNIDSQMLVLNKSSDDPTVIGPKAKFRKQFNKIRNAMDSFPLGLYSSIRSKFSISWLPFDYLIDEINRIKPDIVHLQWICGGALSIENLRKIKFPIVLTLHDMWTFTGGCHYDEECGGYKTDCRKCVVLNGGNVTLLSRKLFSKKVNVFKDIDNLTVIGVSQWLVSCAAQSLIFKDKRLVTLPNLIDTKKFNSFNKQSARDLWMLPQDKKLILFGALSSTTDSRKGFKELCQALKKIKNINNVECVVFGGSAPEDSLDLGIKFHYLGHLHDDVSLVSLYSAVDVMIVPSIQEAFGQTAIEAMACKTPVVAFGYSGLLDIIDHKLNGYLATPFDVNDLSTGIDWVLDSSNYDDLCKNAREKVLQQFDSVIVAKRYIELYNSIL